MRMAKPRLRAVDLPFRKLDELVENPSFLCVVSAVATLVVAAPMITALLMAAPLVAARVVTVRVVTSPFQNCELVAEHAHVLRIAVIVRLTSGFADLALEPCVESPVDLPLRVSIAVGSRLLPPFGDADDLI